MYELQNYDQYNQGWIRHYSRNDSGSVQSRAIKLSSAHKDNLYRVLYVPGDHWSKPTIQRYYMNGDVYPTDKAEQIIYAEAATPRWSIQWLYVESNGWENPRWVDKGMAYSDIASIVGISHSSRDTTLFRAVPYGADTDRPFESDDIFWYGGNLISKDEAENLFSQARQDYMDELGKIVPGKNLKQFVLLRKYLDVSDISLLRQALRDFADEFRLISSSGRVGQIEAEILRDVAGRIEGHMSLLV